MIPYKFWNCSKEIKFSKSTCLQSVFGDTYIKWLYVIINIITIVQNGERIYSDKKYFTTSESLIIYS